MKPDHVYLYIHSVTRMSLGKMAKGAKKQKFDTYDCVLCRLDRSVVNAAGRLVTLMTFTVCITRMQIHNTPNNNMQCYVLNELLLCLFVEFV